MQWQGPIVIGALGFAVVLASACSGGDGAGSASSQSTTPAPEAEPTLATAPESQRVDLEAPVFSNPTTVDNPLFPISDLHSAILLGNVDGDRLRIETVLLPEPKIIELEDGPVETLVSQFVSYTDGRIHEVALDWYGQSDDGAVWYFGEDVFNYEGGVVADTDGTWVAGKDGPVAMIMPAGPQAGDVYRPENIPDRVFEEVTVTEVGLIVDGPRGPVPGAIIGEELHLLEGYYEDKTFAPGYGEFASGIDGSLEALAVAVPTDALPGPAPEELEAVSTGAIEVLEAAQAGDWEAASSGSRAIEAAWTTHRSTAQVPPNLALQMDAALGALAGDTLFPAVDARNGIGASDGALDVLQASLDLQLQYRPPTEIDRARLDLWTRQLVVDTGGNDPDPANIAGDVTTLEWIWDRVAHTYADAEAEQIEAQLEDLRTAADEEDVAAAAEGAAMLSELLVVAQPPA
jgi:hypothetical protein